MEYRGFPVIDGIDRLLGILPGDYRTVSLVVCLVGICGIQIYKAVCAGRQHLARAMWANIAGIAVIGFSSISCWYG